MTLLHLHHEDLRGFTRNTPVSVSRVFRRISAAFRLLHRSIVSAKLQRLQGGMLFRQDYDEGYGDYGDILSQEQDIKQFPQRPLVLGDKWDF